MSESPTNPLSGLSPARMGITSLISACLAWASLPLILVVGLFLALCATVPLVLIGVVTGMIGVGTGISGRNPVAIITGLLGLLVIGCLGLSISSAMNF